MNEVLAYRSQPLDEIEQAPDYNSQDMDTSDGEHVSAQEDQPGQLTAEQRAALERIYPTVLAGVKFGVESAAPRESDREEIAAKVIPNIITAFIDGRIDEETTPLFNYGMVAGRHSVIDAYKEGKKISYVTLGISEGNPDTHTYEPPANTDVGAEVIDSIMSAGNEKRVKDALEAVLTPKQQLAIQLRILEEKTVGQTAQELGMSPNATTSLIYRALGALREQQVTQDGIVITDKIITQPKRRGPVSQLQRRTEKERIENTLNNHRQAQASLRSSGTRGIPQPRPETTQRTLDSAGR